jgi:hypothetical protein
MSNAELYDDDEFEGEWQPGECDRCATKGRDLETLPPFTPVCACDIGQGAPTGECECESWVA